MRFINWAKTHKKIVGLIVVMVIVFIILTVSSLPGKPGAVPAATANVTGNATMTDNVTGVTPVMVIARLNNDLADAKAVINQQAAEIRRIKSLELRYNQILAEKANLTGQVNAVQVELAKHRVYKGLYLQYKDSHDYLVALLAAEQALSVNLTKQVAALTANATIIYNCD